MKNIITIQHPQSLQHVNGMIGSWTDWDLTEMGIEHANRIGKRLSQEIRNERYIIYSSDLLRTKHTAKIISDYLGCDLFLTEELREFNFGEAIGKSKKWALENTMVKTFPEWKTIDEKPFIDAECKRDVWNRLNIFHDKLISCKENNIIIVSHSGTLSLFYALWLGLSIEMLNNCDLTGSSGGISFLQEDMDGKRVINRLNDLSYTSVLTR